jgi:hypothetical protein
MTAGAGVIEARSRPAPGTPLALAVSLALHLLAALLWVQQQRLQQWLPIPQAPRTISIRLQPPAPPRVREQSPPPAPRPHESAPRPAARAPASTSAPTSAPTLPAASQAEAPAAQPDDHRNAAPAATSAPTLDEARAPADVRQAIRDQAAADGGFAVGLSKRQAGRIDRELRHEKSGVPDEPDTPMGRFRRGLERAHVDRSMSVHEDSYTAPDGVIIYRKRIGKATICRRSGSVSPLGMRGMLFGSEAGDIECPKGVTWKQD